MADTWGDIIGRGYSTGRAIGNDFAEARFAKKADALRTEFQQRAEAEGKNLEDYLPEMEEQLRQLSTDVGATRRNVKGRGGQALDVGAAASIREDIGRAGERRAGGLAADGFQAQARDERAGYLYKLGDRFDDAQGQQIAGDTIRATSGAMRADGTYNMAGGAQALAGVAASYGNADQANAQQQGATTFRLKAAVAAADSVFNIASNISNFSDDQLKGAWAGFSENVPELKGMQVQKGDDNKIYLYRDGQASGSFDPADETDLNELSSMMSQFTKAPGEALQGYQQARLKSIEEQKTTNAARGKMFDEARLKAIDSWKAAELPDALTTKLIAATTGTSSSSSGGGWQLQEISDDPGQFMVKNGGKFYVVKTGQPADPKTGLGGGMQVFTDTGNGQLSPVPPGALNSADTSSITQLGSVVSDVLKLGNQQQIDVVKGKLSAINAMQYGAADSATSGGGSSGGNSRADRNNNPGNIKAVGWVKSMPGFRGTDNGGGPDSGYASFDTPEQGMAAMQEQLRRYTVGTEATGGKVVNTVAGIVNTWAPPTAKGNDAESTGNYAAYVAKQLGVDPNTPISPDQIPALANAMYQFESGNRVGSPIQSPSKTAVATTQKPTANSSPVTRPTAQSAAPAQTALPQRASVSGETVRDMGKSTMAARSEFLQAQRAVELFDQDNGTQMSSQRVDRGPMVTQAGNLNPQQQQIRSQLVARAAAAEQQMKGLTGQTRIATGALAGSQEQGAVDAGVRQYASRGVADFMAGGGSN